VASNFVLEFEKPIIELEQKVSEMRSLPNASEIESQINELEANIEELRSNIYAHLTRWQRVQIARHPDRPYSLDYVNFTFSDFVELHGDRGYRDDPAIVGGLARLDGIPVMVIGHQKGRDTKSCFWLKNLAFP
jgi:acetyl-CoA carboxylase carboxyl transferase subunit alpha